MPRTSSRLRTEQYRFLVAIKLENALQAAAADLHKQKCAAEAANIQLRLDRITKARLDASSGVNIGDEADKLEKLADAFRAKDPNLREDADEVDKAANVLREAP